MQGWRNFLKLIPKNLSWKVMGKSRRAKSETSWFRRNPASEPWTWPTKSRWKDREIVCPWHRNRAGRVLRPRTWKFLIKSTWFGGSCSGLGRWISHERRRFRLRPSGFPDNFSRQIFWYQFKKKSVTLAYGIFLKFWKITFQNNFYIYRRKFPH